MFELMLNAASPVVNTNEFIALKTAATQSVLWVVPADVTSICVVVVGDGALAGGGLSYRNDIPVTPDETLTLEFNLNATGSAGNSGITRLLRGTNPLCTAYSGGSATSGFGSGGFGGKSAASYNTGGGNGGTGYITGSLKIGGGAGGYAGQGGPGTTAPIASTAPAVGSGAGAGARSTGNFGIFTGGDVGLHGIGNDGASAPYSPGGNGGDGSISTVMCGGGNNTTPPTYNAGIRIIWGAGRSFPNNAK